MNEVVSPGSADEALDMLRSAIRYLAAADATAMTAEEQARCLRVLEQVNSAGTAARTSVLSAFASAQGHGADAEYSPRAWLIHKTGVTRGAAMACTAWVRRAEDHPRVFAAMAAEELSESVARILCQWTNRLPEDCRDLADDKLVAAAAAGMSLRDLAELFGEIYEQSRSRSPDQDTGETFDDRAVRLITTFQGAGVLSGDLTPECAEAVAAVLDALSAPAGAEDDRTQPQRLLKDLARLDDRVWLVLDDVHELGSAEARRQLELLLMRGPPELRFVLATRHDLRLGLHRLRLEGELAEIRAADLRFSLAEAGELFVAAGVELPEHALVMLHARTEGWAAGLRLAALSLAGYPDPARFAAEFSGSERTVAEYLLAEVLDRQSEAVRRLLLRTSILEQVNGELADALTGDEGGERVLQELEAANAFVVALDVARSWFRYHRLFADLLQLQLRRSPSDEIAALHHTAAQWYADHGYPMEAIRHAQAAQDWGLAVRLLGDHWPGLQLGGQAATVHAMLVGFPAETRTADAELAVLAAADELARGSLEEAERYLGLAARGSASVPAGRRSQMQVLLGVVRLLLARQRGDLSAAADQAQRLQAMAEAPPAAQPGLGEELRALALVNLGTTEFWAARFDEAQRHLEKGVALAHRIGRPYLEFIGRAHQAGIENYRPSFARAAERSRQAIELARRHGWTDEPAAGHAYVVLANALAWQGRPEEAEAWIGRAERTVRPEAEPATALAVYYGRGLVELISGRDHEALAAFRAAERLAGLLAAPHLLVSRVRAQLLHTLARIGETEPAEHILADLSEQDREPGEVRIAVAALRLAQDDPLAATTALAPVLDASAPVNFRTWLPQAFVLEALARDALGDPAAAGRAMERALHLAEPDGTLSAFLLHPAPGLLERHARDYAKHAVLVGEILSLLPVRNEGPGGPGDVITGRAGRPGGSAPRLAEPLSQGETRVLRYLPTNLSAPEIARELSVSVNTVRTHIRHVCGKLGAHGRTEAVTRARALGLLAPSPHAP